MVHSGWLQGAEFLIPVLIPSNALFQTMYTIQCNILFGRNQGLRVSLDTVGRVMARYNETARAVKIEFLSSLE